MAEGHRRGLQLQPLLYLADVRDDPEFVDN